MAVLIKPPGNLESVEPKNGKAFTLPEMQGFVGGYIEALRLANGKIMWLNEDGKRLELPRNYYATTLATGILRRGDYIVGNVLLATPEESGERDDVEDHELLEGSDDEEGTED